MKNRNCPNKDMCWDYNASRCEGCAVGEKIAHLSRQNKKLKAENAELRATLSKMETVEKELRERLEKAVELPCKVGDTVYEKGMYEGDVYEHRIRKIIFDAEKISFDCTAIGNSIFLTRAEAEARLKEISEKKDDERPKKND